MRSVAERFALADHVQSLWYPQRTGAWLKVVPAAPLRARTVAAGEAPTAREVLETFLDSELYNWLPEDSAYGTLTGCAWRSIDRAELARSVDEILADAARGIAEIQAEEATRRAEAEAGGYLDALGPSQLDGDMIDLEALRRWFTDELWGAAEPAWFTNIAPGFDGEPAAVGVDGDLLAILWPP